MLKYAWKKPSIDFNTYKHTLSLRTNPLFSQHYISRKHTSNSSTTRLLHPSLLLYKSQQLLFHAKRWVTCPVNLRPPSNFSELRIITAPPPRFGGNKEMADIFSRGKQRRIFYFSTIIHRFHSKRKIPLPERSASSQNNRLLPFFGISPPRISTLHATNFPKFL